MNCPNCGHARMRPYSESHTMTSFARWWRCDRCNTHTLETGSKERSALGNRSDIVVVESKPEK